MSVRPGSASHAPSFVQRALGVLGARSRAVARADDQRPILGVAAGLTAALSVLALLGGANALLFDNLQELVAAGGGAVGLVLASRHGAGITRRLQAALAVSLGGAFGGMVAWDLSHVTDPWSSTVGDLLFVAGVAVGAVAMFLAIFRGLRRDALIGVGTDTLILFLAGITVVAALWTTTDGAAMSRTASAGAAVLVAASGACGFAFMARRIQPAYGGPWVLLLGATVLSVSWLMWVGDPGAPSKVGLSDFLFSAGVLLIALGGATWTTRPATSPTFDRLAPRVVASLPVTAILGSLAINGLTHGSSVDDLVGISTAAVIVTSVGRQVQLYLGEARARDAERRANAALEAKNSQLRDSAAEIEDLYGNAPVGYHSLDRDGLIVRMNDTELAWLGYERAELVGRRRFVELLRQPAQAAFEAGFAELTTTGVMDNLELELVRKDGSSLHVLSGGTAVHDADGRFVTSRGTLWDLSERRRAERAMSASEERFRTLFEQATDAIVIIGPDGTLVDANPAFAVLLGAERSRLRGRRFGELIDRDARAVFEAARARLRAGEPVLVELALRGPEGGQVVVEASVRLRTDHNVQILMRDLSARRAAEVEQRRLVTAVDQAADEILVNDATGVIRYVNPAFERSSGYPAAEVLGRTVADVLRSGVHPPEFYAEIRAATERGEPWEGTIVDRRRDGTTQEHRLTISPIHGVDGTLLGTVHVGKDLTRERELEAQLRQAAKMEAVGKLAGGVAHDFNNILTAIKGFARFARLEVADTADAARDIDQVIVAADRAAELTRQLLAFGRKTVLEPQVVDPAAVVGAIVPMLRRLLGEQIELTVAAAPGAGLIRVDPVQLEQVIINLAVNARDAMPEGGDLRVDIGDVELDASYVRGHPGSSAGPHVLITVSDTGEGMDAETRAHIFEPFYTTKAVGEGTGMGLATVFGIVTMSGASIDVDSAPGRGTRFRLYFPRVAAEATRAFDATVAEGVPTGSETILLVEDDTVVRSFARRSLESLGYTVLEARTGAEALTVAAATITIDLLVTDIVMPGIQGPELRLRLRKLRPGLPTLLVSGYPRDNPVAALSQEEDRLRYLAKPYSRESLAGAVRTLLDVRG